MIYGELGRFPLTITINKRMAGYWYNLVSGSSKLSSSIYKLIYQDFISDDKEYKWISNVKNIFDETGMSYAWLNQRFIGSESLMLNIRFVNV